jgi:putative membrane protein
MELEKPKGDDPVDPRIYFAAERTLLAWVRTGLAMMGFGFVVARFGLFLREIAAVHSVAAPREHGISVWGGTTLVILGVAVNVVATIRNWQTIRRLEKGEPLRFHPLSLAGVVALIIGAMGLVMAAYLLFGVNS